MDEIDANLAAALKRWEERLDGPDAHKELAERMTAEGDERPVSVTQVHDWFSRRGNRRPPVDAFDVLYDEDDELVAWWNVSHGRELPKRIALSWEQERALYRAKLAQFGDKGREVLAEIDARPRTGPRAVPPSGGE